MLRREGIADAEIARRETERGRKRKADEIKHLNGSRKRSRSDSSDSSDSVSTISTNLSRSLSPERTDDIHTGQSQMLSNLGVGHKRRRDGNASMSYSSDSSRDKRRGGPLRDRVSDDRRQQAAPDRGIGERKGSYSSSRSASSDSDTSTGKNHRKLSIAKDRSKRRRHSSRSPVDRGRDRDVYSKRSGRRTHSPTISQDRGEVIRNRKSMTPNISRPADIIQRQEHHSRNDRTNNYSRDNDRYGSSVRDQDGVGNNRRQADNRPLRIERSLSPFSKRLALTQAMNIGH